MLKRLVVALLIASPLSAEAVFVNPATGVTATSTGQDLLAPLLARPYVPYYVPAGAEGTAAAAGGGIGADAAASAGALSSAGSGLGWLGGAGVGMALALWPVPLGGCDSNGQCSDMRPTTRFPLTDNPAHQVPSPSAPSTVPPGGAGFCATDYTQKACTGPVEADSTTASSDFCAQESGCFLNKTSGFCDMYITQTVGGQSVQTEVACQPNTKPYILSTTASCGSGYTMTNGKCVLNNPRAAKPDKNCDVGRSGGKFVDTGDTDCYAPNNPAKLMPDGSLLMSGKDENGNPVIWSAKPTADGGTQLENKSQWSDGTGNSYVQDSTATVGPDGNVKQSGQSTQPGTVNTTDGSTQTAPSGSVQPGSGTSTGTGGGTDTVTKVFVVNWPDDYARKGEADSAGKGITDRLLAPSSAPSEPPTTSSAPYDDSSLIKTLKDAIKFEFPGNGQCPALEIKFSLHDQDFDITDQFMCSWFDQNSSLIGNSMMAAFMVLAFFIVLGA